MPEPSAAPLEPSAARRFLTFRVDDRRYALRAQDVAEVIRLPSLARIPQSPRSLLGLANLRGSVLPVASLRGLLGMGDAVNGSSARAIVLDLGAPMAIVVDAVDSLVTVAADRVATEPAEVGANPGERLEGMFQSGVDDGISKIIDIRNLLETTFAQRGTAQRHVRGPGAVGKHEQNDSTAGDAELLVTFEVAGQEFALDLAQVQEILPRPRGFTAVPHAEALVLGMTTYRETLLPLLSLRGLLGFPSSEGPGTREKVVVVKVGGARVGLVADRARSIVAADASLVDELPSVLAARVGGESRIRAVYRGEAGRRLISILAPEQLFREDVMRRLGAEREKHIERPAHAEAQEESATFVVFRLGDDEFGLPIDAVDEVAQVPSQVTRLPRTPAFLEGVVNLRGDVLPVIDQRARFDMARLDQGRRRRLLVVRTQRHRAGLIVDSVSDVMRIPARAIEPAPDLTSGIARLVTGVANLGAAGRMVLLLDPTELLTQAERGLLDAFESHTRQATA
jgi:purine-binding chemotaxis protein CheW